MKIMRIFIATGLFPPDIGGPAQYAKHLYDEFEKQGHSVKVVSFRHERKMPQGIRHLFYFVRIFYPVKHADIVFAMDTFSVGMPAVIAAKLLGKKVVIRIGGDFLWESYVENTGKKITLPEFNKKMPELKGKLRLIHFLSRFVLRNASALAFNTVWQKTIWRDSYALLPRKLFVVENYYPPSHEATADKFASHEATVDESSFAKTIVDDRQESKAKTFLWAGRMIKLKNVSMLTEAFKEARKKRDDISLEIITDLPHEKLFARIQKCYAVILPSYSDIHPNFIIDAVSAGKPFIMTHESGLYERLKDVGLFVDPFNARDITEKILFLADEKNYRAYKEKVMNF